MRMNQDSSKSEMEAVCSLSASMVYPTSKRKFVSDGGI